MPFTNGIGFWEVLIILAIVLLVFGPKRMPELGRSMGRGLREFKDSVSGRHDDDDDASPEIESSNSSESSSTSESEKTPLEGEVVHNPKN